MTTVMLVMYYGILIFQFTKMVRVGDVFRHDSSCSAQTKFNINSAGGGRYTYTWLYVHKCLLQVN